MNNSDSFASKLFASGKDALNPLKLLVRILMFIVFGIMTALPYLVSNLNEVYQKVEGGTTLVVMLSWIKALTGATAQGMLIGLSTVWDALLRFPEVIGNVELGTMLYVGIVILFTTWSAYQPLAVLFDIGDMMKGQHFNKMWALVASFVLVLFIIAPISYAVEDGATITSGVSDNQKNNFEDDLEISDVSINNSSELNQNNDSIVNSLNMLIGG